MVGSRHVQSRSKTDVIDRFFSWGETTFCPHDAVKDSIPLQEDSLDYVFDGVESFVCRNGAANDEMPIGQPLTLQRDNSLIEACNSIQAKFVKTKTKTAKETTTTAAAERRDIKPIGERGDILDFCFEHVESYACGERATGELNLTDMTHRGTRTTRKSPSPTPKEEAEDEVHLYYRPNQD